MNGKSSGSRLAGTLKLGSVDLRKACHGTVPLIHGTDPVICGLFRGKLSVNQRNLLLKFRQVCCRNFFCPFTESVHFLYSHQQDANIKKWIAWCKCSIARKTWITKFIKNQHINKTIKHEYMNKISMENAPTSDAVNVYACIKLLIVKWCSIQKLQNTATFLVNILNLKMQYYCNKLNIHGINTLDI